VNNWFAISISYLSHLSFFLYKSIYSFTFSFGAGFIDKFAFLILKTSFDISRPRSSAYLSYRRRCLTRQQHHGHWRCSSCRSGGCSRTSPQIHCSPRSYCSRLICCHKRVHSSASTHSWTQGSSRSSYHRKYPTDSYQCRREV